MIKIGGNEFRTLAQPIFVNGKHVREVWANGNLVYPETVRGNTIKIRGHILEGRSFSRPERYLSRYEPWMSGEIAKVNAYTATFSLSASFAAVFQYSQDVGLHEDGITLIPVCGKSFDSENIPTEGHWQYSLPYDMFYPSWNSEDNYMRFNISPICMPFSPLDGSPVPTIPSLKIVRETPGYLRALKIMFRIDMAPIPLSDEYLYTYYSPLNYYHTDQVRPIYNGLFSACNWNGQIIRSENVSTFSVPHPWIENASMSMTLGNQDVNYQYYESAFPSYLTVSLKNLMDHASLISNHHDSTEAILTATINNLVNVPITDVLYIGRAEEAPEWALDVTESDLF